MEFRCFTFILQPYAIGEIGERASDLVCSSVAGLRYNPKLIQIVSSVVARQSLISIRRLLPYLHVFLF